MTGSNPFVDDGNGDGDDDGNGAEPVRGTGLTPPVRTLSLRACPRPDDSFPVALCRTVATTVDADSSVAAEAPALEPLASALIALEGYVRLRRATLSERTDDRETALLASDYLFARAHGAVGTAPLDAERALASVRAFTAASSELPAAIGRSERAGDEEVETESESKLKSESESASEPEPEPTVETGPLAVLAGCGCVLGAIVGDRSDAADPLRAYGRQLGTLLDAVPGGSLDEIASPPERLARDHRKTVRQAMIRGLQGEVITGSLPDDPRLRTALVPRLEAAMTAHERLADHLDETALGRLERPLRWLEAELGRGNGFEATEGRRD
ncbi:hypothetical protein [Natronosalvus halobius]|uniref:hypothetical protein n=1 Tax=Natronosalvus halobius TaxID=2953746 RepID=UPI00209F4CB5|nr:hypothetical protein [Natronosalvus halobius]USZ70880.1 hypothetical protein NGM15_12320 [Natronosalvus halobius]